MIKNPVDLEDARPSSREFLLWVGRDHEIKQPLLYLALARLIPHQQFVMILNESPDGAYSHIAANKPSNLRLIKSIPLSEIEQQFFSKATLFISTAVSEGFPNTFLQAAKFSVPVISMNVNPFGYISEYRCGEAGFTTVEEMAARIEVILQQQALYEELANNSYLYVSQNHDLRKISIELGRQLGDLQAAPEAQI